MKRLGPVIVLAAVALIASTAPAQGPPPSGDQARPPAPFNPLLRVFDSNRDGVLSDDEITGATARLNGFDRNKDGKLSEEELREALPIPGRRHATGRRGRGPLERADGDEYRTTPRAKNDQEKQVLATLEEARGGPRFANVSPTDGRLLRLLAEAVDAKRVVEIGTSTGESGLWFTLALRSTGGHLFTHEIDPERVKIAEANFKKAGVDDLVTIVPGDAHETVKEYKEPIDVLFLDADKAGYIDYLKTLLPLVRAGGLVIAHNMSPGQADMKYVNAVTKDPDLETSFLLMDGAGVGVTLKKR